MTIGADGRAQTAVRRWMRGLRGRGAVSRTPPMPRLVSAVRFASTVAFVCRASLVALAGVVSAGAGCAHAPRQALVVAPAAADTPALWTSPPPPRLYRFVGRVRGVARSTDLVTAARVARDDLRWKAYALGADVVRIDYVAAPPEHGASRPRVLLAGAAYKAIAHP